MPVIIPIDASLPNAILDILNRNDGQLLIPDMDHISDSVCHELNHPLWFIRAMEEAIACIDYQ